jgi:ring-1,2-phenylacetyl-CoA epoxidase subunit PaaC
MVWEGPYLEEDIALTNIALDELGQANNFYQYASRLMMMEKAKMI